MQKQKKPFSLMAFIRPHRAGFITSTVLAVLSVASGMVPYFAVARMVNLLISGEKNFSIYLTWGGVALIAYLLKSILHGISTRCSHEATFHVLSELRRAVADKLTRVSMGYLTDTPSGRLKTTMVERVEQMEVPLAHIIPEMTANLLIPLAIVVYLFVLDWRMALVSLLTIPVGIEDILDSVAHHIELQADAGYLVVVRGKRDFGGQSAGHRGLQHFRVVTAGIEGAQVLFKVSFPLGAVSVRIDGGAQIVQLHFSAVSDVDAIDPHRGIQQKKGNEHHYADHKKAGEESDFTPLVAEWPSQPPHKMLHRPPHFQ